jgi:hypothetical protein
LGVSVEFDWSLEVEGGETRDAWALRARRRREARWKGEGRDRIGVGSLVNSDCLALVQLTSKSEK